MEQGPAEKGKCQTKELFSLIKLLRYNNYYINVIVSRTHK